MKRVCRTCKEEKEQSEFYSKTKTRKHLQSDCKQCSNLRVSKKMVDTRIDMLEYKGNECEHCGLKVKDAHYSLFEFHHLNPAEKDKDFSTIRGWSWDKIVEEINTCALLCANCHRMEHVKLRMVS